MKTYNGYTIEQVKNNLPKNMIEEHKQLYLNNCKEVIKNNTSGTNLNQNENIKNSNFMLIQFYNDLI